MNCLDVFATPQLEKIHRGKVRDSYRVSPSERLVAVSDRISAFDSVLKSCIPCKGAVLNAISNYWFSQTQDIIANHLVREIDPCVNLVREAEPVRIEMIVRGYLTGSMWRGYEKGKRNFSGVAVKDGMKKNDKFDAPIVTPTTKEDSDREITPDAIVAEGWTTAKLYTKMSETALALYERGSRVLYEKGIVLVDTKYEFGLIDGALVLIDEIHTPDSSRFWKRDEYEKNPSGCDQIDKEYVRQWLIANMKNGAYPDTLPEEVVSGTAKRYCEICEIITGIKFSPETVGNVKQRVVENMVAAGLMAPAYVCIVMGSPGDAEFCASIKQQIDPYAIPVYIRTMSAHKNGEDIVPFSAELNASIEPGAVIAVAGRSNGLGGALSANLNIPVINCPPFKDSADIMLNVNSSLVMPSRTPATTVVYPDNAALAALRALNLSHLRAIFSSEINGIKKTLRDADRKMTQHARGAK